MIASRTISLLAMASRSAASCSRSIETRSSVKVTLVVPISVPISPYIMSPLGANRFRGRTSNRFPTPALSRTENRLPGSKVQDRRSQTVHLHLGIAVNHTRDTRWLSLKQEPRHRNRIAPNVHQTAPAERHHISYVLWIAIEVAERAHDGP